LESTIEFQKLRYVPTSILIVHFHELLFSINLILSVISLLHLASDFEIQ
jgi:hypothetical protein